VRQHGTRTHQVVREYCLVDALGLAHGGLDVEGLDVLPVLLEEGDEEVDGNLDVSVNLVLGHLNVGHSDTEGKDLLELELDGTTDGVDLLVGVLGVLEEGWELTELVHGRSEETRNLLHDGGRGKEEVVAVGELLDLLLVLVERLETLDIHARDASGLGLLDVLGITKDATGHAWARNVRELDGTGETLILLRIVVLEDHLELDGFTELALLVLGTLEDGGDGLFESFGIDFTHI